MREPRQEGEVENQQEATPETKKKAGRPPKAAAPAPEPKVKLSKDDKQVPNPYSGKFEIKKYEGNLDGCAEQKFDSKGRPAKESRIELLNRSRFFANYVNGRYKIIMVYKGRGNNKHHGRFDIINPKKDKLKFAYLKQKGIIF